MNILLALNTSIMFRFYDRTVRKLCGEGHGVHIACGETQKANLSDRALSACIEQVELCTRDSLLGRKGISAGPSWTARELRGYAHYLHLQHPSPYLRKRWRRFLPIGIREWACSSVGEKMLSRALAQRMLLGIEAAVPPVPEIIRYLQDKEPDVVLATPYIFGQCEEVEYIKAALALHIPTIVGIASWDNLTTKGTFPLIPDITMVWNQAQAEEAVLLHGIPRERIVFTGAQVFDPWFEAKPSVSREEFCREVGLHPGKQFILYLCSSRFIAGDETAFVAELVDALASCDRTRDMNVLVRPHPLNAKFWGDYRRPNVAVWPKGGDVPDVPNSLQEYYNSLFYSSVVIGVNTSGFLEAAIADRPCITILDERYRDTQSAIGHFQHLLNGEFLHIADHHESAVSLVAEIAGGNDQLAGNRREFVRSFIRPCGLDKPASDVVAEVIRLAASGKAGADIQAGLCAH